MEETHLEAKNMDMEPTEAWHLPSQALPWMVTNVLPYAGPPLACALCLPMSVCLRVRRKRKGWLGRSVGLKGTACAGGIAALLVAAIMFLIFQLLSTAAGLEAAALNATMQASRFICTPSSFEAPPPSAPAAFHPEDACLAGPASSYSSPSRGCAIESVLGFTEDLTARTSEATSSLLAIIHNLSTAVDSMAPASAASGAAASLTRAFAANLSSLNESISELKLTLHEARSLAAPYYPNAPTAWAPLAATAQHELPTVPRSSLVQSAQLASQLEVQHDEIKRTITAAALAVSTGSSTASEQLHTLNASVSRETGRLDVLLRQAVSITDKTCSGIDASWQRLGLPSGNARLPTSSTVTLSSLRFPMLHVTLGFAVMTALPLTVLMAYGTVRGKHATGGSHYCLGTMTSLFLILLFIVSAAFLTTGSLLGIAVCDDGQSEELLNTLLFPLGNLSLPTAMTTVEVPIATAVVEALSCGTNGRPDNVIELLGLRQVVDFSLPLSTALKGLDNELNAFGPSAVAPMDAALASLPQVKKLLAGTSTLDQRLLRDTLHAMHNVTDFMSSVLPAADEPGLLSPGRLAWVQKFSAMYGTPGLGPDPQMVALNARLRQELEKAGNLTLPTLESAASCNSTAQKALYAMDLLTASLLSARSACELVSSEGRQLQGSLTLVVDDLGRAEKVTRCDWLSAAYLDAKKMACKQGKVLVDGIGFLLAAFAWLLFLGTCVVSCTRFHGVVAVDLRSRRSSQARAELSSMPAGDLTPTRDRGRPEQTQPTLDSACTEDHDSPFSLYTLSRRTTRSDTLTGMDNHGGNTPRVSRASVSAPLPIVFPARRDRRGEAANPGAVTDASPLLR